MIDAYILRDKRGGWVVPALDVEDGYVVLVLVPQLLVPRIRNINLRPKVNQLLPGEEGRDKSFRPPVLSQVCMAIYPKPYTFYPKPQITYPEPESYIPHQNHTSQTPNHLNPKPKSFESQNQIIYPKLKSCIPHPNHTSQTQMIYARPKSYIPNPNHMYQTQMSPIW